MAIPDTVKEKVKKNLWYFFPHSLLVHAFSDLNTVVPKRKPVAEVPVWYTSNDDMG